MQRLIRLYHQVYNQFSLRYLREFQHQDLGLTEQEYTYLGLIKQHGQLTPSAFADLAGMTRAGATQTLNKFAKRAWVEKESLLEDKRSILVTLTPSMLEHFQSMEEQLNKQYQQLFSVLTTQEQEQLEYLLGKLARVADKGEKRDDTD